MQPLEMSRRLRHDLIKHLDIPSPDCDLSESEAHVLLRRLFDTGTGLCRMAEVWGFKFRRDDDWNDALEKPLARVEAAARDLAQRESQLKSQIPLGGRVPPESIAMIKRVIDAVHAFEDACADLHAHGDDEKVAFDFFQFSSPIEANHDLQEPESTQERLRVLVVDDHLMSIDRLQAHPTFRKRFTWATRCDKSCECLNCPEREQCELRRARTFRDVVNVLGRAHDRHQHVDALLMDVRFDDLSADELLWIPEMPDLNHEEDVKALQGLIIARELIKTPKFSRIPIVLMTALNHLPQGASSLLEALEGFQFVDDDDSLETLATRVESVVRMGREAPVEQGYFWGSSPKIQAVRRQIEIMSLGPRTVYLAGPSGAGKSSLVEQIIFPLSQRKKLVTLDLSSVPDTLVESELFGHVKGAYSGATHDRIGLIEEADGGILFLDEIGNLSLENQRKLLLFLQDKMVRRVGASHESRKHVDVKVVVATHLELSEEVAAGRFRFDLYMRFGPAMRITLPSLAERRDDLPAFIENIAIKIANSDDMKPHLIAIRKRTDAKGNIIVDFASSPHVGNGDLCIRFKDATRELFLHYAWPGNTRELESVLDTLILKALYDLQISESKSRIVEIDHYYAMSLLGGIEKKTNDVRESPTQKNAFLGDIGPQVDFAQLRKTLEKRYLCHIFERCQGDIAQMGEVLFHDPSAAMQHKITVRLNQLGLSLRKLRKL